MLRDYLNLLRVRQWYKNLLVFLALIYSGSLLLPGKAALAILAFAALCCASSAAYILNDLADAKKDRLHPEKRLRPIAAGKIRAAPAIMLCVLLLIAAAGIGAAVAPGVAFAAGTLFSLTLAYTLIIRDIPYAELAFLSTNYVVRAIAGAVAISVAVSPWLIVGIFALALFLASAKRRGDMALLGTASREHKAVLGRYSKKSIGMFATLSTAAFVTSYLLFSVLGGHEGLWMTAPLVVYAAFRYELLARSGSAIARSPESAFSDWRFILTGALWLALTLLILY